MHVVLCNVSGINSDKLDVIPQGVINIKKLHHHHKHVSVLAIKDLPYKYYFFNFE